MLAWLAGAAAGPVLAQPVSRQSSVVTPFAKAIPGYKITFPHDEGAHPDFRLEWWYLTGWLNENTAPMGFQVTFFRVRPELQQVNPSAFAPGQILIVHAALSDPSRGRLAHVQRAARAGFGLAGAGTGRARVWIDDWALEQAASR